MTSLGTPLRACAAALLAALAAAVCEAGGTSGPDLQEIVKRGYLKVAVVPFDDPPFIIHNKDGTLAGLDKRILDQIGKELDVEIRTRSYGPYFQDVIEAVAAGKADIGISEISGTLLRKIRVDFTRPYFEYPLAVLVNRVLAERMRLIGPDGVLRLRGVKGLIVGVVKGSAYERHAKRFFPNATVRGFTSYNDALRALERREVTFCFHNEGLNRLVLRERPAMALRFLSARCSRMDPIAIVVAPGRKRLGEWLDAFIVFFLPKLSPDRLFAWYEGGMKGPILHLDGSFAANAPILADRRGNLGRALGSLGWGGPMFAVLIVLAAVAAVFGFGRSLREQKAGGGRLRLLAVLQSRWLVLLGIAAGVGFGIFAGQYVSWFRMPATLYISALKMCSLPIMLTAVTGGLARLVRRRQANMRVLRFFALTIGILLAATLLTFLVGVIARPGADLAHAKQETLGRLLLVKEFDVRPRAPRQGDDPWRLTVVPENVFNALSKDEALAILVFSVVFGIALGLTRKPGGDAVIAALDVIYGATLQIVGWVLCALPLGVCCILAWQISRAGVEALFGMRTFVITFYAICLGICLVALFLMSLRLRVSFLTVLKAFRRTLATSFASGNEFAALPVALEEMESLPVDVASAGLTMPLGFTFCDVKKVSIFALAAVFFAQQYGVPISAGGGWWVIPVGAALASLGTSGMKSAVYMGSLSLIFGPLGLPASGAVSLLFAVYPLIDPIGSAANVAVQCAVASLAQERPGKEAEGG